MFKWIVGLMVFYIMVVTVPPDNPDVIGTELRAIVGEFIVLAASSLLVIWLLGTIWNVLYAVTMTDALVKIETRIRYKLFPERTARADAERELRDLRSAAYRNLWTDKDKQRYMIYAFLVLTFMVGFSAALLLWLFALFTGQHVVLLTVLAGLNAGSALLAGRDLDHWKLGMRAKYKDAYEAMYEEVPHHHDGKLRLMVRLRNQPLPASGAGT